MYNVLASVNSDILKTSMNIKSFMNENIKDKIRILSSVLDVDHDQQTDLTAYSLRSKDPDWFQGILIVFMNLCIFGMKIMKFSNLKQIFNLTFFYLLLYIVCFIINLLTFLLVIVFFLIFLVVWDKYLFRNLFTQIHIP